MGSEPSSRPSRHDRSMPGLQEREEDKSPPENEEAAAYERQLSELLDSLKTDSGNPDLWMEAATVYLALGRRRRASKAFRASIKVVNERKSEEAILAAIHRLLHGDYVPALETGVLPRVFMVISQAALEGETAPHHEYSQHRSAPLPTCRFRYPAHRPEAYRISTPLYNLGPSLLVILPVP